MEELFSYKCKSLYPSLNIEARWNIFHCISRSVRYKR